MKTLYCALGGGNDRKEKAVELYNSDPGSLIYFTGEPENSLGQACGSRQHSDLLQLYLSFGVQMVDALGGKAFFPPFVSKDTLTDIQSIKGAIGLTQSKRVVIITSDYHMARVKMVSSFILGLKNVLPDKRIGITEPIPISFIEVPSSPQVKKAMKWKEIFAFIRNYITMRTGLKV